MKHEITSDSDFTLKTMELVNFMGYKNLKLNFEGKDIVGILAAYAKDKTRSNRSGKSTIPEAVRYNLTGKSRTKFDKDLIHNGEKFMENICTYTDGEKDYVVRRGVDAKGKGLLEIDWVTNVVEAQTEIDALFGTSADDFDLTNFFKQADIMGIMGMKSAEKTTFLMKYIENQHWVAKEAAAKSDLAVVKQKVRDNDNLRATLEGSLEVDISLEGMKVDAIKAHAVEVAALNKLKNQRAELKGKLANLSENKNSLSAKYKKEKLEIGELENAINKIKDSAEEITDVKRTISEIAGRIGEFDIKKTLQQVSEEKSALNSKIDLLNNQINSAGKNKGICPIIKKECGSIAFTPAQVEGFKTLVLQHKASLVKLEKEANDIDKHSSETNKLNTQKAKLSVLLDKKADVVPYETKLAKLRVTAKNTREEYEALSTESLAEEIETLAESISEKEDAADLIQVKINKFDARIQQAKNNKEKIEKLVEENEKLKKEMSLLNHTVFMFSKRGIPSGEIENAFGEIEEKINYCLTQLNAGLQISFSADRETTEKEPICSCGHEFEKGFKGKDCPECATPRQFKRREEINFTVVEGDKEQSFDLDSGGGKQIICYAVKIALTYFKRRMSKCRLNMLFLDEIDSALDPYLANQIISSVTNFLTTKLGFKQIIMVSHKEQIKNSMPHMIKVVKHDTYSTARFV